MPKVQCKGKDGVVREFDYAYESPSMVGDLHTFFIGTDPLPLSGNRFQMTLRDIDDHNVCLEMSKHFEEMTYASKGIAEAMIPVIARVLDKNVHSSSGIELGSGHYRLPRATAYWKRTTGAMYDEAEDVFTYPRPAPAVAAEATAGEAGAAPSNAGPKEEKVEAGQKNDG